MAGWNGSGVFTRVYSWLADAAAGIDITASRMDADTNNIVSNGFGNCITRDGQGSAVANQPMNGFHHTGVGNGTSATDYVAVGQLLPPGVSPSLIPTVAYLGEIRQTALPETLLATLMPGWHVCDGSTRARTDPLWLATGAVSGANWAFGNGNGTTTYTLPDRRGRVGVGKDDMGGSAANRVTNGVSGIAGATLAANGGDQHAQQDTITIGGSLPAVTTVTSTANSVVTDPGHTHDFTINDAGAGGTSGYQGSTSAGSTHTTASKTTGITVATSVSSPATTTVTNGVTATSTLTGGSQNMPPALIENVVIFTGA